MGFIKTILNKYNVDRDILLQLWKTQLRMEFRKAAKNSSVSGISKLGLLGQLLFYIFMSFPLSVMAMVYKDLYSYSFLVMSFTMVFTFLSVMMEYSAVLLNLDDYMVIGCRPVSSNTYALAKILNILSYTLILTIPLILLPSIILSYKYLPMPLLGILIFLIYLLSTITVVCLLSFFYVYLLKIIPPAKLKIILQYTQLFLAVIVFTGYQFVPIMAASHIQNHIQLSQLWYLAILPMGWYAGVCSLLAGVTTPVNYYSLAAVILLTPIAFYLGIVQTGRFYLGSMAKQTFDSEVKVVEKEKASKLGLLYSWLKSEHSKAGFMLIATYMRRDHRLRMVIIPYLVMIVVMIVTLRFGKAGKEFIYIITGYVPVIIIQIYQQVSMNEDWKGSWIYHSSPLRWDNFIWGARMAINLYIIIPLLIFMLLIFTLAGKGLDGAVILCVAYMMGEMIADMMQLLMPQMPLSNPTANQGRTGILMVLNMVGMLLGIGISFLIALVLTGALVRCIMIILLFAVMMGIRKLTSNRTALVVQKKEFSS
jgi:hypothetical protein